MILSYDVSAALWSYQHQQCHWTSPPVIISPPCFLSVVFHRYSSPAKTNTQLGTRVLLYLRYFLCGPLSYRACVCVLIDVCVQLLLYMFRGQHKIIPQHSRSKSSTKPPSPFLTCQFKMATRPFLFSRHPIPSAIAKYTPYEAYTTYFDHPLHQSTVFTTALSNFVG